MTTSRAPAEPTVREFEATVESVDGRAVVLNETYFYPESGGQPADRGTLDGHPVDDVVERDGAVVHTLDADPGALSLAPGDAVTGVIDDAFRTYCARAHTASHVLYGAARRIADDLGYAGFDISETKVRVDLTTAEPLDDDDLIELERLTNRAVWDSLPVSWETHSAEEAREIDGIAFNVKTEEGAMSDGAVRVVTVGGASAAVGWLLLGLEITIPVVVAWGVYTLNGIPNDFRLDPGEAPETEVDAEAFFEDNTQP